MTMLLWVSLRAKRSPGPLGLIDDGLGCGGGIGTRANVKIAPYGCKSLGAFGLPSREPRLSFVAGAL
jgi:hypothetical protein